MIHNMLRIHPVLPRRHSLSVKRQVLMEPFVPFILAITSVLGEAINALATVASSVGFALGSF